MTLLILQFIVYRLILLNSSAVHQVARLPLKVSDVGWGTAAMFKPVTRHFINLI